MSAPSQRVTVPAGFFTASTRPTQATIRSRQRPPTGDVAVAHDSAVRGDEGLAPADWLTWLRLSSTPAVSDESESARVLHVRGGVVIDPAAWPPRRAARIYVAYGVDGPAYVGQTWQSLVERVRRHFGSQRSRDQQLKAGTWHFIVTAAFDDLGAGDLDALESHAAHWLLPRSQRQGRRHPRPPR